MLRIGIPNRSSALHVAGATALIRSGVLRADEYHPAKLYYEKGAAVVTLTRCDQLCSLFSEGLLDAIFTGGDYSEEHILPARAGTVLRWPVLSCHYALLGLVDGMGTNADIFTKFPNVANHRLTSLETARIKLVGGACESYVLSRHALAFDVVCTGATVNANGLSELRRFEDFCPVWHCHSHASAEFANVRRAIEDEPLAVELRDYYLRYFGGRDAETAHSVLSTIRQTEGRERPGGGD